ncbi:hypothetical protein CRYUN_Cryun32bG0087100 [Craigia yunnanensis]
MCPSNFVKKSERKAAEEEKFTNLYVKNLVDGMKEDLLEEIFSRYGKVFSVVIMKDGKGSSRCFGFVNFQSPDDAKKALEAMNGVQLGTIFEGRFLYVAVAQRKEDCCKELQNYYVQNTPIRSGIYSCIAHDRTGSYHTHASEQCWD